MGFCGRHRAERTSFRTALRAPEGNLRVLERFPDRSNLLRGIENFRLAVLEANPNSALIPTHSDTEQVLFVVAGSTTITLLLKENRESYSLRRGDILTVHAGTTLYIFNRDNNEKLFIAKLLETISVPGQAQEFFGVGGRDQESFYMSFTKDILEAAFNPASGHPMLESDLQQVILNGLDTAYDPIVTSLTTTIDDTSMEDFNAHLLAFESRLQNQLAVDSVNPFANVAAKSSSRNSFSPSSNRGRNSNNRGRRNTHRTRQRSRSRLASGPCQLCGRKNHMAASYWYRFDHQYNADSTRAYLATSSLALDQNWHGSLLFFAHKMESTLQGSMSAPYYNSKAIKVALVVEGKGYVEIVSPYVSDRSRQGREEEREESVSYQRLSAQLSDGQAHSLEIPASCQQVLVSEPRSLKARLLIYPGAACREEDLKQEFEDGYCECRDVIFNENDAWKWEVDVEKLPLIIEEEETSSFELPLDTPPSPMESPRSETLPRKPIVYKFQPAANSFIVPAGHPFVVVADHGQDLRVLCFDIKIATVKKNEKYPLAGRDNIYNEMNRAERELFFKESEREVEQVLKGQKEAGFFDGPQGRHERESEGRSDT
ncbi:hypothetical protein MRB53_024041 [Persea americana]|uniref:Uncharacterized protein n=1 Tax=Persea americana TaxID=3435 RepID=A0ACC2LCA2_PERAE|nr:hypothetical protein MRB53_024041 [Persea americana]